jgi:methylisocitrate lyase
MTEFGKSKLLTHKQLENAGYNIVIYPVTLLRLAMKAAENGLDAILKDGTQESTVPTMQTRQQLYDLTEYSRYNEFDQNIFNFKLK